MPANLALAPPHFSSTDNEAYYIGGVSTFPS